MELNNVSWTNFCFFLICMCLFSVCTHAASCVAVRRQPVGVMVWVPGNKLKPSGSGESAFLLAL